MSVAGVKPAARNWAAYRARLRPRWASASGIKAIIVAQTMPLIAERTVSSVGGFMVAGQRVQLGRGHAHQVVTAHLSEDVIRVFHSGELITTVPHVTTKEVVIRKSGEHNRRKIV